MANTDSESRVKPQPLQPEAVTPEEIEYLRGEMAQTASPGDWAQYWMKRLIANIEEARRAPASMRPELSQAAQDRRDAEYWRDDGSRTDEERRFAVKFIALDDALQAAEAKIERRNATYRKPGEGFVCFHCGERFTDYESAKEHFGEKPDADARCIEETRREQPVRVTDEVVNAAVRAFVTYARVHADERDVTLNAMRATLDAALAVPKEGE